MTKRKLFSVRIDLPDGMLMSDIQDYIDEAVTCWRGQYQPHVDPRWDIDPATVKVTPQRKKSMRIYTNTSFTGHYPVGTAAVVHAFSPKLAANKLNQALKNANLTADVEPEDMKLFKGDVSILLDGQY